MTLSAQEAKDVVQIAELKVQKDWLARRINTTQPIVFACRRVRLEMKKEMDSDLGSKVYLEASYKRLCDALGIDEGSR
jgi:hypothetical protein